MAIFQGVGDYLSQAYSAVLGIVPPSFQTFIKLFVISLVLVIYAFAIWKFYQSIGKKNLIGLNLKKYGKHKNAGMEKFLASMFYFLEYIVILPLLIFLWFAMLTIFLVLLTERDISSILLLSVTLIAAIRMLSYFKEDIAKEIAKIVPLTLLATTLLNPEFFSVERILGQISQLPELFGNIYIYLMFIVLLELVLRVFDFVFSIMNLGGEIDTEEEDKK